MKTTTLGRSGLEVSRIAFDTWQLGGDWRATSGVFTGGTDRRNLAAVEIALTNADLDEIEVIMDDATSVTGPSPEDKP